MTQWRKVERLALCFVFAVAGVTVDGLLARQGVEYLVSKLRRPRRESIGTAWSFTVPVTSAPVQIITKEDP
jgi:hypothetical protein